MDALMFMKKENETTLDNRPAISVLILYCEMTYISQIDLTDDEDESCDSSSEDETCDDLSLGISESLAKANLLNAGLIVDEAKEKITVAGNKEVFSHEVDVTLEKVLITLDLPYKLAEFQRVSVNVIGKN